MSGSQDFSTTVLIDGVPTKSPEYGDIGYALPPEMIAEFNIQRGFYSAKYPGAGVVNVASRSGKNQIHGVAWEAIRNDVLDARSFFDTNLPPLRQNHFGGAFGGPIKKDKLFYFGNVQFVRDIIGSTQRGSVPTAQEMTGDLSDIPGISIHDLNGNVFSGGVIPPNLIDIHSPKSTWHWAQGYFLPRICPARSEPSTAASQAIRRRPTTSSTSASTTT